MKPNLRRYLISAAVGLVLAFVLMAAKGIFKVEASGELTVANKVFGIMSDCFFASGVLLTCVGVILYASNNGLFDMLAFGVGMLFTALKRDVTKRKYKDFYEYKVAKGERKRSSTAYLMIVGLVFVAIGGLCLIGYSL